METLLLIHKAVHQRTEINIALNVNCIANTIEETLNAFDALSFIVLKFIIKPIADIATIAI